MVLCLGEEVLVVVECEYVLVCRAIVLEVEVVDILHLVGGEVVVELVWRHCLYLALVQLGTHQLAQCSNAAPVVVPLEVIVDTVEEWLVAHLRDCVGECLAILCVVVYLGEELVAPLVDANCNICTLITLKGCLYHPEPLGCRVTVASKVIGKVIFPQTIDTARVCSGDGLSNAGFNRCATLCNDVACAEFLSPCDCLVELAVNALANDAVGRAQPGERCCGGSGVRI